MDYHTGDFFVENQCGNICTYWFKRRFSCYCARFFSYKRFIIVTFWLSFQLLNDILLSTRFLPSILLIFLESVQPLCICNIRSNLSRSFWINLQKTRGNLYTNLFDFKMFNNILNATTKYEYSHMHHIVNHPNKSVDVNSDHGRRIVIHYVQLSKILILILKSRQYLNNIAIR